MKTTNKLINKYQNILPIYLEIFSNLKYFLFLLLVISIISCNKENVIIDNETTSFLGEKAFHIGSYNTIPMIIEPAKDSGFVVVGYASDKEREEYPFLMLLNDSLKQKNILYPAYNEIQTCAEGLAKLSDGYVILSTTSTSPIETNDGVRLTKVSFDGEKIWEKKYFSGVTSYGPNISADRDNSIVVACVQSLTPDSKNYSRIARIDSNGNLLWSFDIHPGTNRAETILTNKQDNYVAIIDSITYCYTCEQDLVSVPIVHMINKDGKILWKKRLDSNNGRGWSSRAAIDNNNDIIIAYEPGNQDGSFYYNKKVIMKLSSSGTILWQTTLSKEIFEGITANSGGFEKMREITIDKENNIYVTGNIQESKSWGPRRLAIAKLSTSGEVIKTKIYKEESQYRGISIKSIANNKLIVLAYKFFPYKIAVFYINEELEIQ